MSKRVFHENVHVRRTAGALVAIAVVLALASIAGQALGDTEVSTNDRSELARRAIDPDRGVAEDAIARLRAMGPRGHAALMEEHAAAIARLRSGSRAPSGRLRHAIDVVSAQRDGHASGLYWFTDLDAARAEARRTNKPILSLRLLGRLDEELSCANSRFFRVVLYPDPAVADLLSRQFVLHWSSERPAPRITIDMGDGRRIERTITGNSVHYVLDAEGRVIDALPGLYAPREFVVALERARGMWERCDHGADAQCLQRAHTEALAALTADWERRRARIAGLPPLPSMLGTTPPVAPDAVRAMPLTIGKAQVETPMLRGMTRDASRLAPADPIRWDAAAALEIANAELGAPSRALISLKTGRSGDALETLARRLASVAASDGVRNEATMHSTIHRWLAEGAPSELALFNARVYAGLFLTPASDPWLGLRPDPDAWDAVETLR